METVKNIILTSLFFGFLFMDNLFQFLKFKAVLSVLIISVFIFIIACIIIYKKIKNNDKKIQIFSQLIFGFATILAFLTYIAVEAANEWDINLRTREYLCIEYKNNIDAINEIAEKYNKCYQEEILEENIDKNSELYTEGRVAISSTGECKSIFLDQYFSNYAIRYFFDENPSLLSEKSDVRYSLGLDISKIEIGNKKLERLNDIGSYISTVVVEDSDYFVYLEKLRADYFFQLKEWSIKRMKDDFEQRKNVLECSEFDL